jgi:hypothetical protein
MGQSKKNYSVNSSTHPQQSLVSQRFEAFSGEDRRLGAIPVGCGASEWSIHPLEEQTLAVSVVRLTSNLVVQPKCGLRVQGILSHDV